MPRPRLMCIQQDHRMPGGTSRFLKLPEDILYSICDQLQDAVRSPMLSVARFEENFRIAALVAGQSEHPLFNISMACKKLRLLCLSRIFRYICLSNQALDASLRAIFIHARRVFVLSDNSAERISAFLQLAPNIREVYFQGPEPLLSPFLHSDRHEVVALAEPRTFQQCNALSVQAPLRVFIMRFSSRHILLAGDEVDLSAEQAWLEALLPRIRSTLETLVVPAESTRLTLLAEAPWPRMRELVLDGACPPVDVSLLRIFEMMPNLRTFSFTAALRYSQSPLLIWPSNATETPDISHLRHFTISSPSIHDLVYVHLPAEIEGLALRDSPRFYERSRYPNSLDPIDDTYSPGILTCSHAFLIFKKLSCAALVHLELVVIEDEQELDLLAYVANACPLLEMLEFHCYRNVSDHLDLYRRPLLVSLDALARSLSAFLKLRDVRLNIDTPWSQFTASRYHRRRPRDGDNASSDIARNIVQAVPWIDTIAILTRNGSGLAQWITWTVQVCGGVVDIERLEVDPSIYYRTWDY